jgi:hypothetical protein
MPRGVIVESCSEAVVQAAIADMICRQRFVMDGYEVAGTDPDVELS